MHVNIYNCTNWQQKTSVYTFLSSSTPRESAVYIQQQPAASSRLALFSAAADDQKFYFRGVNGSESGGPADEHPPHVGGKPKVRVCVWVVVANHDGVRHRQQAHHGGLLQKLQHLVLVNEALFSALGFHLRSSTARSSHSVSRSAVNLQLQALPLQQLLRQRRCSSAGLL